MHERALNYHLALYPIQLQNAQLILARGLAMSVLDQFVKTYSDRAYTHTAMVRHKGTVIAFALDDQQKIWYTVLDLQDDTVNSPIDVTYWTKEPALLPFPTELGQAGYRIAGLHTMPDDTPDVAFDKKTVHERWLSTTGRLTADAPFQVLSDGRYVFVFRQSIGAGHGRMVEANGQPVVNNTLLVDRFVFTGGKLKPALEARYQRSRHKDRPLSRKDTLGAKDIDGHPFFEPTHEVDFIRNLEGGRFSVLLLPTATPGLQRWQIFAFNSKTQRIDAFNIERAKDGLFNTRGTVHYTSPLTEYQDAVYEDRPGTCPHSGLPMIPIVSKRGYAETALAFDGVDDHVDCGNAAPLQLTGDLTLEAWIYPTGSLDGETILSKHSDGEFDLTFWGQKLDYYHGPWADNYCRFEYEFQPNQWYHIAVVRDAGDKSVTLFVNGQPSYFDKNGDILSSTGSYSNDPPATSINLGIGARIKEKSRFFKGKIDEVRIWNRTRAQQEIKTDMNVRLVGNEPGLVGYWRFDEGQGTTVHDQTDHAAHGTIEGDAAWVMSDAPVGEHPGIRRSSFSFEDRSVASGMTSLLYHQQGTGLPGYAQNGQKPLKKNARVMLATAAPTPALSFNGENDYVDLGNVLNDVFTTNTFTIELWAYVESYTDKAGNLGMIINKWYTTRTRGKPVTANTFILRADGTVSTQGRETKSRDFPRLRPRLNTWHHIALSFDAGTLNAFVNGRLVATDAGHHCNETAKGLRLGGFWNKCCYFQGKIADVRIWDEARTASQIQATMHQRLRGDEAHLKGFWPLDEKAGKTVYDRSSSGHHGVINNNQPTWTTGRPEIAVLDFAVSRHGKLALVPDVLPLPTVGARPDDIVPVAGFPQDLADTQTQLDTNRDAVTRRSGEIQQWEDEIEDLRARIYQSRTLSERIDFLERTMPMRQAPGRESARQEAQAELNQARAERATLPPIAEMEQAIKNKQKAINENKKTLIRLHKDIRTQTAYLDKIQSKATGEVQVAMPLLNVDVFGHSVSGGVLTFAQTQGTPHLFESANAKVNLYVRDPADQFLTAYFDVNTAHAAYHLPCDEGHVVLIARNAEREMTTTDVFINNADVKIENTVISDPDYCNVMLVNELAGITETWKNVPRAPYRFVNIFNGRASGTPGDDTYYDYSQRTIFKTHDSPSILALLLKLRRLKKEQGDLPLLILETKSKIERLKGLLESLTSKQAGYKSRLDALNNGAGQAGGSEGVAEDRDLAPSTGGSISFGSAGGDASLASQRDSTSSVTTTQSASGPLPSSIETADAGFWEARQNALSFEHRELGKKLQALNEQLIELEARNNDIEDEITATQGQLGEVPRLEFPSEKGSILFSATAVEARGVLQNGEVKAEATDIEHGQWVSYAQGNALTLNGTTQYAKLPLDADGTDDFDTPGDLTLEAWIHPDDIPGDQSTVMHHKGAEASYSLGLQRTLMHSALTFDGNSVDCGDAAPLQLTGDLTLEAWIFPTGSLHGETIISKHYEGEFDLTFYNQKLDYYHGPWQENIARFNYDFTPDRWYHLAVVRDAGTRSVTLFVDGQRQESLYFRKEGAEDVSTHAYGTAPPASPYNLGFGARIHDKTRPFKGKIAEVRLWDYARYADEINADIARQLSGNEAGLRGYWRFEENRARDYSRHNNHGTITGKAEISTSPLVGYRAYLGVGNQKRITKNEFACGSWTHLAGVFKQSYALAFNGKNTHVDCGNDAALNLDRDLTLEAFLRVDDLSQNNPVITKGFLQDGAGGGVPYALTIEKGGAVVFSYENKNLQVVDIRSTATLTEGAFYRLAVVRKYNAQPGESQTTTQTAEVDGQETTVETPQPGPTQEWFDYTFYITPLQGASVETRSYPEVDVFTNNSTLIIGGDAPRNVYFKGVITEMRLWNTALEAGAVNRPIQGHEQGLVAWWRFDKTKDHTAEDIIGYADGAIHGGTWQANPDPFISGIRFLINGVYQELEILPDGDLDYGAAQMTLGATKKKYQSNDNFFRHNFFNGEMDEIRIWKTIRTQEQIQDNLFRRLLGEKEHLIAYYQCDAETGKKLSDHSGRGHHLTLVAPDSTTAWPLSTAPVSYDTPQARSVLSGIKTDFNEPIHSTPAVQEYGDMQFDAENNRIGALKRCYTYVRGGQWKLITGFKVGNLFTEWIAQIQYDPQLMGYIEGAPPVPGENLTAGPIDPSLFDYGGATSVKLTEAEEVTFNYSTSKEGGLDTAFDMEASLGFNLQIRNILAPLGIGVSVPTATLKINAGIKGSFESSNSISETQSAGIGKTKTQETSLSLRGKWEPPDKHSIATLGRRYIPANTGMALVKSATADVFALRLSHNNALVAYRFVPNQDIPEDWNIITFPINPRYTKQGTLDGKIGLNSDDTVHTDEHYPYATEYGEWSYFKPRQAYALKKEIEKEEEQRRTYYKNLDVSALDGATIGAGLGVLTPGLGAMAVPMGAAVGGALDAAKTQSEMPAEFVKSSLMNTYVWTAAGGFFAETEETTLTQQETFSGTFSMKGMAGATAGLEIEVSGGAGGGFTSEMSAMMGGHLTLTSTKTQESSTSYGLNIAVDVPGDLQKFDPATLVRQYDEHGNPELVNGKVDAYRFMTFYLKPDTNHFDHFVNKVIDYQWLSESNHPNALALREAIQAQKNAPNDKKSVPWRVMHRVTFVSRLMSEVDNGTLTETERALKAADINSNYELIKKLEPYVKDKVDDGYAAFTDAVRDALRDHLPELQDAEAEIIAYMCLYFQVFDDLD